MPNRQPIAIKHEYIRPNPNQVCIRWSCRWNPSHCVSPDGDEAVLITSIVFCARADKTPARICNCSGYYFSQFKKTRPHCYHVDVLEEQILKIHVRELAQYESNLASAQDQYNKASNGSLKIRGKKYADIKRECERVLLDAINAAKNYLMGYPYLMNNWVDDFPHITKHTELMRREHGQKS
tara:strand:- start:1850 stop:2392 length:543 start_codon:yes stop_codon:yes gene_type:complete